MVRSFVYTNYIYIFAVQILTMCQTTHRRVLSVVIFFSSCRNDFERLSGNTRKSRLPKRGSL